MGKHKHVTIWDGLNYVQVSEQKAKELVKQDKAQICPVDGTRMKFRKQFTGYQTREMRADVTHDAPPPPAPKEKEPEVKPWTYYKKAAAQHLGKTVKKTKKADVVKYMEKHLGLEV